MSTSQREGVVGVLIQTVYHGNGEIVSLGTQKTILFVKRVTMEIMQKQQQERFTKMPTMKGTCFQIGADPEFFLKQKRKGGRFIGAWEVTSGTKQHPILLPWPCEGKIQVDGFALEFNTTPKQMLGSFVNEIKICRDIIQTHYLSTRQLKLSSESTVDFDDVEWERAPEENRELGCDPDYSAYTLNLNPTPDRKVKFRTAAGHIHIGWGSRFEIDSDYISLCAAIVREMDATLGVASLLFDPDTKRRSLYGKAGAFRPKQYGVEYRVLSNRWTNNSKLVGYIYKLSFLAIKRMMYKQSIHVPEVQDIINNDDKQRALEFLYDTRCPLPPASERIF